MKIKEGDWALILASSEDFENYFSPQNLEEIQSIIKGQDPIERNFQDYLKEVEKYHNIDKTSVHPWVMSKLTTQTQKKLLKHREPRTNSNDVDMDTRRTMLQHQITNSFKDLIEEKKKKATRRRNKAIP